MNEQLKEIPAAVAEGIIESLLPEEPITDELANTGFLEGEISAEIQNKTKKRIVVSNRLPVNLKKDGTGKFFAETTYGGLVTAMQPILNGDGYEGIWVGWAGEAANGTTEDEIGGLQEALLSHADKTGIELQTVTLTEEEQKIHYEKVSNGIFWGLDHATLENHLIENVQFENQQFYFPHPDRPSFISVQRKFAEPIIEEVKKYPDSQILLQDYHLPNTARILKEAGVEQPIGFFLHIPYPPIEILQEPRIDQDMIADLVDSLTYNDLIGFHTEKDVNNFLNSVEYYLPEAIIDREQKTIEIDGRITHYGDFLISIDVDEYKKKASTQEVIDKAKSIKADFPDREVMLAGGRLDYTKGFDYLLEALDVAFEKHPDLIEKLTLILYTPKSRGEIDEYRNLAIRIDELILKINTKYGKSVTDDPDNEKYVQKKHGYYGYDAEKKDYVYKETEMPDGWRPIIHLPWGLQGSDQLGMMEGTSIAAYPSVIDGANLMAQESSVAAGISLSPPLGEAVISESNNTVIMLGKDAGSFQRMKNGVIPVNPLDIEAFAEAIYEAVTKTPEERQEMMEIARESVESYTIFQWAHDYTHALENATN